MMYTIFDVHREPGCTLTLTSGLSSYTFRCRRSICGVIICSLILARYHQFWNNYAGSLHHCSYYRGWGNGAMVQRRPVGWTALP